MKFMSLFLFVLAAFLVISPVLAQEEMNMDQWQQEINNYTAQRNELQERVRALDTDINNLQAQSTKADDDIKRCLDELYALVGSNVEEAAAYRSEIEAAENTANDLMRLSDADLAARGEEVNTLATTVDDLWKNKLSVIPEFYDRLTALNDKVKSLQTTLGGQVKTYTVGTWSRNRDCLWNIAKKQDIYGNAWLWPKIWQGNRDQIRDPDIIQPGQKLKIPQGTELTQEERTAARRYYSRRARAAEPTGQ